MASGQLDTPMIDPSSQEKREFIREVVRESNKDQRDLVEKHSRMFKTKTT